MATRNATHSRHRRHRWRNWAWRQINNSFAIRPWTGNALRWTFADQQTIAWAAHVFFARRCIPNGLSNRKQQQQKPLGKHLHADRFYRLTVASLHWLHLTTCCSLLRVMSIMAWHTRHVTMGTPLCWACWYDGGNSSGPTEDTVVWSALQISFSFSIMAAALCAFVNAEQIACRPHSGKHL